jgi:hypothetical protein
MAGIEQAFENFVKRVSSQEEPQSEYGEPQTGDKRIPIYQNINQVMTYTNPCQQVAEIFSTLQLGANANMVTGKFSPNEYQNVSTMNRNVGLRGRYDVPDSGIALLGSIGDVRSNQNVKTNCSHCDTQ